MLFEFMVDNRPGSPRGIWERTNHTWLVLRLSAPVSTHWLQAANADWCSGEETLHTEARPIFKSKFASFWFCVVRFSDCQCLVIRGKSISPQWPWELFGLVIEYVANPNCLNVSVAEQKELGWKGRRWLSLAKERSSQLLCVTLQSTVPTVSQGIRTMSSNFFLSQKRIGWSWVLYIFF